MSYQDGGPSVETELAKLVAIIERLADTVEAELARRKEDEARQAAGTKKTRSALNTLILVFLAVGVATPFLWWNDINRLVQQYAALVPIGLAAFAVLSNLAYRAFQAGIVDLEYVMLGALLITAALAQLLFVAGGTTTREAAAGVVVIGLGIVYVWHEAGEAEWQRFKELFQLVWAVLMRPVLAFPLVVLLIWYFSPTTLGAGVRPWLILLAAVILGAAGSFIIRIRQRPPRRAPTSPEEVARWGPVVDELMELVTQRLGGRGGKVKRLLLGTALSRTAVEEAIMQVANLSPYFGGDEYVNLAIQMRSVFDRADHQDRAESKGGRQARVTGKA